jgi:hypothetical protein
VKILFHNNCKKSTTLKTLKGRRGEEEEGQDDEHNLLFKDF